MDFIRNVLKSNRFLFFLFRLSSVLIIQTAYVPDEYWQSLEVAHNMVFGYGYLTWEWKYGLRSYLYPTLFAAFYKILDLMHFDNSVTLKIVPRMVQASLTAISDDYFYKLCRNLGLKSFWTKLFMFTNWFWYFCSSRTLLNTFETSLTTIGLYLYPWNLLSIPEDYEFHEKWTLIRNQSLKYLTLVAVNCMIRPTAVTIWAPLVLYQLIKMHPAKLKQFVINTMIPIVTLGVTTSVTIDYFWYKKLIFPPINFFITNIYSGIASFYGSHPFHWYMTQGIPVVLSLHVLPFLGGCYYIFKSCSKAHLSKAEITMCVLLAVFLINIIVYSLIPHKEFRFILPLLPIMEIIAIKYASESRILNRSPTISKWWSTMCVIGFVLPTVLFGLFHQRGTLSVMNYLSDEAAGAAMSGSSHSYLFLTPCHSTPLYSHLHMNVSVRFLKCDPPLTVEDIDESDIFFKKPLYWLEQNWSSLTRPTHVILFDTVKELIEDFLIGKGFELKRAFQHTIFSGTSAGDKVLVYQD